jgi:hypothetical protein
MKLQKKNIAIVLIFFVLFGAFFSWHKALAWTFTTDEAQQPSIMEGFLSGLTNPVGSTARAFVSAIIMIFGNISKMILSIGYGLLSWATSSDFITMSMTGPDNPIVSYGWAITRDLANIFLVLGFVVIGLGIILGIEEYQAKKTIPRLIAVALMINFTLVICGFIIDFSNTLMKYFLSAGNVSTSLNIDIIAGLQSVNQNNPLGALAKTVVYSLFGLLGGVIYLLYFLLFAGRYFFLWILVIFSPIAFVSRVFPEQSKNIKTFFPSFFYWDEWWKQFIQWCVIGIYAGFFISLANQLMGLMASGAMITSNPTGDLSFFGGLFTHIFPLILLLIGFFSILETGAPSVPGVGQLAGKIPGAATGAAGLAVGAVAGGVLGEVKALEKAMKEGKGAGRATYEAISGGFRGAVTSGGREQGMKALRGKLERVPGLGRAFGGPGTAEAEHESKLAASRKRGEAVPDTPIGNKQLAAEVRLWPITEENYTDRIADMEILAKRKDLPDDIVKDYGEQYQDYDGNINTLIKASPHMSEVFKNNAGQQMTIQEGMARIEPNEFWKTVQKDALKNKDVVFEFLLDEMKFFRATRNMKAEHKKIIKETVLKGLKDVSRNAELTDDEKKRLEENIKKVQESAEWQV